MQLRHTGPQSDRPQVTLQLLSFHAGCGCGYTAMILTWSCPHSAGNASLLLLCQLIFIIIISTMIIIIISVATIYAIIIVVIVFITTIVFRVYWIMSSDIMSATFEAFAVVSLLIFSAAQVKKPVQGAGGPGPAVSHDMLRMQPS